MKIDPGFTTGLNLGKSIKNALKPVFTLLVVQPSLPKTTFFGNDLLPIISKYSVLKIGFKRTLKL